MMISIALLIDSDLGLALSACEQWRSLRDSIRQRHAIFLHVSGLYTVDRQIWHRLIWETSNSSYCTVFSRGLQK